MILKLALLGALFLFTFAGAFAQDNPPAPDEKPTPAASGAGPAAQDGEKKDAPKKPKGGVVNGAAISLPKPVYPRAARVERAGGKVSVNLQIDEEGKVISATAVSGHPLLRAAAEEAAKQALFIPTLLSGRPIKVPGIITYNFLPEAPQDKRVLEIAVLISLIKANQPPAGTLMSDVLKNFPSKVPTELGVEPTLFDELTAANETERAGVLSKITEAVTAYLSNEEKWHFNVGTRFGNILAEIDRLSQMGDRQSDSVGPAKIRSELLQVKNLMVSLPPESQPEVAEQFDHIPGFLKHDLRDQARLQALRTVINAFL